MPSAFGAIIACGYNDEAFIGFAINWPRGNAGGILCRRGGYLTRGVREKVRKCLDNRRYMMGGRKVRGANRIKGTGVVQMGDCLEALTCSDTAGCGN